MKSHGLCGIFDHRYRMVCGGGHDLALSARDPIEMVRDDRQRVRAEDPFEIFWRETQRLGVDVTAAQTEPGTDDSCRDGIGGVRRNHDLVATWS
jgi:hypothetical protein